MGPSIKVWERRDSKWHLAAEDLGFRGLEVLSIEGGVKLRNKARCLAVLLEHGNLVLWNERTLSVERHFRLTQDTERVVWDDSFRYFAGLDKVRGAVTVYSAKSHEALWTVSFRSIKQLEADPHSRNQFVISINSEDDPALEADALLLWQFSQKNLVKYWKT